MKLKLAAILLLTSSFAIAQLATAPASTVAPNENLAADNLPPVPADIAAQAQRYTEFRSASPYDWHPQKRELLISTRFADVPQVHRIVMPGGARTQLTFFPDRVSGASYHPHVGDYFIFSKDIGGGEWFQIFRYDVESGNITMLTDGKSRNLGATWSNKGDRIAYASTRRNRADLDFYVMDPNDKSTDKMIVENTGGGWDIADWSPDDKTLLITEGISVNESYLWLADVATGKKTLLTPKGGEKVAYQPIGFSADGKGIYVTSDKGNEFQRITYIDLATKSEKVLTNATWDVEDARLSWNRKSIAYTLNENGLASLHVIDLATGKNVLCQSFPSEPSVASVGTRTIKIWRSPSPPPVSSCVRSKTDLRGPQSKDFVSCL